MEYNYGLALLRSLMCFEVVLDHFWVREYTSRFFTPFALLGGLAVPVFMFLSFYLTERTFLSGDSVRIKKRLRRIAVTYVLLLAALTAQYSGLNTMLFGLLRYELTYPLGRFCEMVPYATLGFSCAYYNVFERMKAHRLFCICMCTATALLLFRYGIIQGASGFGYSDNKSLPLAFCITAVAYLVPLDAVSQKVQSAIRFVTRYTLGIYCMHRLVARAVTPVLHKAHVELNSFMLCMLIYCVGFLVSFALCKIPTRYARQLVE